MRFKKKKVEDLNDEKEKFILVDMDITKSYVTYNPQYNPDRIFE